MNEYPKSIWKPSPNFTPYDKGRIIKAVIIHATATDNVESPLSWLCNVESKVSSHFLIDQLGCTYQLVDCDNIAWHAGDSEFQGLPHVNEFSVGIELVNSNDGKMAYPDEQLKACADLTAAICLDHDIAVGAVVGHCDIAPGRKTDPGPIFPWFNFKMMLESRGVKESKEVNK